MIYCPNNPFITVTNKAVSTVIKCLGLPSTYEYWQCMYHRELRWTGMDWSLFQYNNMLDEIVKPYFKNKYNPLNETMPENIRTTSEQMETT